MNAAPPIRAARYIGERVLRKEDGRLLTGRGTYVDDVVLPGMLHAAFVRSPIARGKIRSIDVSRAKEMAEVYAILTAEDLAAMKIQMLGFFLTPLPIENPVLATDRVSYVGEPVVLVIADSRALAEDAAGLVAVEYEELDPVVTIDDAKLGPPVHPGAENNVAAVMGMEWNEDLEALLASAPHLVTQTVTHQRISQSPMETRGVVVSRQGAGELILHITCQSPHMVARWVSMAFGLPETSVRVIARDVGGSFGLKNHPWKEETSVIAAGLLLERPIKWIEDRLEHLTAANQCREQEITLRAAFDSAGKLVAAHADYDCNNGAFPHGADANVGAQMFMWSAYKTPAFGFFTKGWYTNTTGLSAYRGPWAIESLARETLLDQAARRMGIDPIELRRRNLVTKADQPTKSSLGLPLEDITPAECLEALLDYFDVGAFRKQQADARAAGRYLGLGIATYIEPTASSGSVPVMTGELAQIRVEPTGKVTATMSTHSQGHGTETTMAQVIADRLGVPYDDVTVFEGDSTRGGYGPGAAGSRQAVIAGGASLKAAGLLADKIKVLAAHMLNASPDDITIAEGMVRVAGSEEMSRSLREIAQVAYGEPARLPPGMEAGLEAQYRYTPPPMTFTSAAHACIVEVDIETGFVKILRWISSEDCGVIINPAVVEGQIAGGLAQGIGTVLLEEISYDARGNPTTATYKDYLLPAYCDIPDFEYVHANTPSQSEGGFRGVGEGGCIIGPPTLVNAIMDALAPFDARFTGLPLSPSRVLEMIDGRAREKPLSPWAARGGAETNAETPEPPVVEAEPPAPPQGGVDLSGLWKMTISAPMGSQEMKGDFAVDGQALSGNLYSDQGDQAFAGTIVGDQLKWEMRIDKPLSMTLKYDVKVEGDRLTGKVKMGMLGSAKLTGERL